jgi:REP element-mobilizing transposase RayT
MATNPIPDRPMAHTYTNLIYHIIFSTARREPLITPRIRDDLFNYIGGVVTGHDGDLIEINGFPDHMHLVIRMKAAISVAEMVRLVKCNSSKTMNDRPDAAGRFGWQDGYGAFSVSASCLRAVCEYVRRQQEHHRLKTFQQEFLEFLRRHEIEFDERYIWD